MENLLFSYRYPKSLLYSVVLEKMAMYNMFFVLNNCFSVDASLNLLTNHETGLQTRLEPRLIEILQMLAENEGKLVSREMLIAKIWNNYGGAEDGLNQGISILRKALADTNKKIIETVPKKGYILHATVTDNLQKEEKEQQAKKQATKLPYFLAIIAGAIVLISLFLFSSGKNKNPGKSEKQPNTVSTAGAMVSKNWQGKNYKLVFDKDNKMTLLENNTPIPDSSLIHFEVLIQELKDKLTAEQDANR